MVIFLMFLSYGYFVSFLKIKIVNYKIYYNLKLSNILKYTPQFLRNIKFNYSYNTYIFYLRRLHEKLIG